MIISPYSKSTKCYGDTVIRRQDSTGLNIKNSFLSVFMPSAMPSAGGMSMEKRYFY